MAIVTVTTSGTEVPLVAANASPVQRMCARVTIQTLAANTGIIYVGITPPLGVGNAVTTTNYDAYLNTAAPSLTLGLGNSHNTIDLSTIYIDASVSGEGVTILVEQI